MHIAVRNINRRFRRTMRSAAVSARPVYPFGRSHPPQSFCSSSDRPNSASSHSELDRHGQTGSSDYYPNQQFRPLPPPEYYPNQQFQPPPPPEYYPNQQIRPPEPPAYYPNQQFRPNPPPEYFHTQQFQPPPPRNPHLSYPGSQPTRNRQLFRKKPPGYRTWELAKTTPCTSTDRFTVLSYNLLADYLVWEHKPRLYYHIPDRMLDWEWRKRNLVSELALLSTDIMCFQEVDRFRDLEEEFKRCGYNGIWKIRTGGPIDGCAIFWRESRFNLLHEESIEFSKFGLRNNVAQICVLELVKLSSSISTSPSSTDSNKVVICNTHVLFNPKRGEIKLAQVRILLETAHAVSKKWNDAPIVFCGDFNSIPKSPLYNYISEQKLDLSMIGGRDKVSGQNYAEIRPPWARRTPSAIRYGENVVPNPSNVQYTGDRIHNASTLDPPKSDNLENKVENFHLVRNSPRLESCNVADAIERSSEVKYAGHEVKLNEMKEETQLSSADKSRSVFCISNSELEEGISASSGKSDLSPSVVSHPEVDRTSETEVIHNLEIGSFDDSSDTSNRLKGSINHPAKKDGSNHYPQISSSDDQGGFSGPSQADMSSTLVSTEEQEKIADLFQTEFDGDEGKNEDENESTFLSALHHNDGALPPHSSKTEVKENQYSDSIKGSSDVGQIFPKSAEWVPFELEIATGRADCTTLEHPLKLTSTYTEAEDLLGIRDSYGEPLATTHHKCFMGTVDYIWRSEGLQTVRVLAPVPKYDMQETRGFPTKIWGSDHIALATELAFAPDQTKP